MEPGARCSANDRHVPKVVDATEKMILREQDIEGAASKVPGALSGGMAKRVGIARAVFTE